MILAPHKNELTCQIANGVHRTVEEVGQHVWLSHVWGGFHLSFLDHLDSLDYHLFIDLFLDLPFLDRDHLYRLSLGCRRLQQPEHLERLDGRLDPVLEVLAD